MNDAILRQVAATLLDTSAKATAVLALAWVVTRLLTRAPAATRHMVWTLAATVVLLLPLLAPALPTLRLYVVEYAPAASRAPRSANPGWTVQQPVMPSPSPVVVPDRLSAPQQVGPGAVVAPTPRSPRVAAPNWLALGLGVWLGGAVFVMLPWAMSACAMRWIGRRSHPASDGPLRTLFMRLREELSIGQRVALLISPGPTMPMTWGARYPRVLLPAEARGWPAERLRCVLLHELAHVRRRDCATQLLAQIACAVHWFNPLAWVMVRRMLAERERACDDVVVSFQRRRENQGAAAAAAYAEHLVSIARSLPVQPRLARAAAVAMARPGRPSQLRRRVLAILDPRADRRALTRRIALLALLAAAAVLLPLAALRVAAATVPKELSEWARKRGWSAEAVEKTTLESRLGGWRNLPFEISPEEEQDVKACVKLANSVHSTVNRRSAFDTDKTRDALQAVLQRRPDFFYAEYLLGLWMNRNGDAAAGAKLIEQSCTHAPAIIVQRFEFPDGKPAANLKLQRFALECNRVKGGSLNPSLKLHYPAPTTDAAGCIYLPTYKTVWRTDEMAWPEGHDVKYPTLGWFEAPAKVGMLPIAVVTPKAGATTAPASTQSAKASVLLVTEGNFFLERAIDALELPRHARWTPAVYDKDGPGDFDVVIFDRVAPAKLPPRCLIFGAAPAEGPVKLRDGLLRQLELTVSSSEHPLVRGVGLTQVRVNAALDLTVTTPPARVLAESGGHALIVVCDEPDAGQRMIVVGFDLLQSNWPTRASFPAFILHAVEYLAAGKVSEEAADGPAAKLYATLQATLAAEEIKLEAMENQMFDFQRKHPTLNFDPIFQQELAELSRSYTQAQLATIEAKSNFGEGHPRLRKARELEEVLFTKYQDKFQQVMKLNVAAADYGKLASDLQQKKVFRDALVERIRLVSATTQPANVAPSVPVGFDSFGGIVIETAGPDRTVDLELDQGRAAGQKGQRDEKLMDDQGIDFSFDAGAKRGASAKGFVRHKTAVVPVEADAWDKLSADQIVAKLKDEPIGDGLVAVDWQKLPAAFLIKTQNRVGLLRLRPIVEPDRRGQKGYWVEHKLVATPQPEPAAAP